MPAVPRRLRINGPSENDWTSLIRNRPAKRLIPFKLITLPSPSKSHQGQGKCTSYSIAEYHRCSKAYLVCHLDHLSFLYLQKSGPSASQDHPSPTSFLTLGSLYTEYSTLTVPLKSGTMHPTIPPALASSRFPDA